MREPDIKFSDEQALILETALDFAKAQAASRRLRERMASEAGHDEALWRGMVELGWTALVIPEAHGGSGLGLGEAVPIVEALGRHLLASPLIPTLLAAQAMAGAADRHEGAARRLAPLAAGSIASLALSEPENGWNFGEPLCRAERSGSGRLKLSGIKYLVPFAAAAEIILATVRFEGAPRLLLLAGEEIPRGALRREVSLDETQRSYRLTLDGLTVGEHDLLPVREGDIDTLIRGATLLMAAEMCGGIAGVLDVTLEYLKTRKQFDRLIGSYQALKHPIVDIFAHYELLRSLVYGAASAVGTEDEWRLIRMAKAKASDLYAHAGDRAVQFHGGFGFTYDCDAGLYLRRAVWSQPQFGDGPYHRRRLAEELLQ